jgi:tetratricopeptide (TPR) repeat protein
MEELLKHLSGPPPAVRRLWAVAVASVILLGYPLIWYGLFSKPDPCAETERRLAGTWDTDIQQQVQAAFTASGKPYAASTWETVKQALDGYSGRWVRMEAQVCQAAQERSQPSENGLAARQACLEQRRVRLEALTRVLAQADARMVDRALDAVGALPNLERCADVEALTRTVRPPETPEVLAQVQSLQSRLAKVQALGSAGKHPEALALAEPILTEARALAYPPLLAAVLMEVASCRAKTGDSKTPVALMTEAWWAAERGRDDALRVEVASQLAFSVGYSEANAQAGRQWGQHAQAVLDRLGGDDALQADLLMRLSAVAAREGRFTEVKELNERALALNDQARGPHHPKRTSILTNLGNAYTDLGQLQRGREVLEEALSLHERLLGVGHPGGLIIRMNLASVLNYLKDFQASQRHLEQVLAQAPSTYGPEHIIVGGAHEGLAFSLYEQGRYDESLEQGTKALAILEKAGGPQHPDLAHALRDLGRVHLKQQRPKVALSYLERALALDNPNRSLAGSIRLSLAQALVELGQSLERARTLAQQAQQDFVAANQKDKAAEVERLQAQLNSAPSPPKRGSRQRGASR